MCFQEMLAHGLIPDPFVERMSKIQDVLLTYIVLAQLRCYCCDLSKNNRTRKKHAIMQKREEKKQYLIAVR